MKTWFVKEIQMTARYFGQATNAAVLPCRAISLLPPKYELESGADGTIQRGITKHPRLLLEGTDPSAVRSLGWQPHNVSFTDSTGETHSYGVKRAQPDGAGKVTLFLQT